MTAEVKSRSMRTWRKFHRYSFGYYKVVSLFTAFTMVVLALTGILLTHQDELPFVQNTRVPARILPQKYQDKLDDTRERQQLTDILPRETKVPLKWLLLDLHTGDFWGAWGRWYYDLIAVAFTVLASTGFYMFFKIRKNYRF